MSSSYLESKTLSFRPARTFETTSQLFQGESRSSNSSDFDNEFTPLVPLKKEVLPKSAKKLNFGTLVRRKQLNILALNDEIDDMLDDVNRIGFVYISD